MVYEAPNTVIIDDSNEFVQYLYNDKKDLRTRHEVLAIMIGFVLEEMTQVIATKLFDFKDAFPQVCNVKVEIEKFLEEKYGRSQNVKDSSSFNKYQ